MPDSGSGPVVSEAMNRKPPFIENSDEGIPLMFTESHVRVATPEESILWERLQAALSVDRERDRTDQRDKNLPNSLDAENGYLLRRVKELEGERDRLVEENDKLRALLKRCDSPDGWCGEMPWELRFEIQEALSSSPTEER